MLVETSDYCCNSCFLFSRIDLWKIDMNFSSHCFSGMHPEGCFDDMGTSYDLSVRGNYYSGSYCSIFGIADLDGKIPKPLKTNVFCHNELRSWVGSKKASHLCLLLCLLPLR